MPDRFFNRDGAYFHLSRISKSTKGTLDVSKASPYYFSVELPRPKSRAKISGSSMFIIQIMVGRKRVFRERFIKK